MTNMTKAFDAGFKNNSSIAIIKTVRSSTVLVRRLNIWLIQHPCLNHSNAQIYFLKCVLTFKLPHLKCIQESNVPITYSYEYPISYSSPVSRDTIEVFSP